MTKYGTKGKYMVPQGLGKRICLIKPKTFIIISIIIITIVIIIFLEASTSSSCGATRVGVG